MSRLGTSSSEDKGHLPALDGLRGLAILLVLATHLSERFYCTSPVWTVIRNIAFGGWTGVDLFFVLSGFLITRILWATRDNAHYFRNFYARRTLRVFPLYYFALTLLLFVLPSLGPLISHLPHRIKEVVEGQLAVARVARAYWPLFYGYLVNVLASWKGLEIFLTHFWSLSVEEHFYLLWPFLVYRLNPRQLMTASACLILGALFLRSVSVGWVNRYALYTLTPFRMDGLALGSLLAMLWRSPQTVLKLDYLARFALPAAGVLLLALFVYKGTGSQYGRVAQTLGYTISIAFYGSLLIKTLCSERLTSIFSCSFLRFFGKYSYSIYVFHELPLFWPIVSFALGRPTSSSLFGRIAKRLFGGEMLPQSTFMLWLDGVSYILFVIGASVTIALVTWRFLEAPCLRLKHWFSYEKGGRPMEGEDFVVELAHS